MAMIHVARDAAKLGEFSLEQVQEGLRTGQFRPTDLGWQTGMPDWRPLAEFAVSTGVAPDGTALIAVAAATVPETGLPWEHRKELGFFKAYFDTVSVLLMKPTEAFTMMNREGGLTDPLFFALIGMSAGMIASLLFQLGFQSIPGVGGQNGLVELFGMGTAIGFLALVPLFMVLGIFLGSGFLHLSLMLLGGAKRPFETTFRVFCFSCGAAYLFSIIPFCGGYVTPIYCIVLESLGLARAHEISTGKAVLAVFLPVIVCCGTLAVLFGVLMASSGGDLFKSFHP